MRWALIRFRSRSTSRCSALVSIVSGRPSRSRRKWRSEACASSARSRSFSATISRAMAASRETKTASARRICSAISAWKAWMSRQPSCGEAQAVFLLLGGEPQQALVDDVADVLEVGGELDDLEHAGALLGRELALHQPRQVELDRLLVGVDLVLERPRGPGSAAGRRRRRSGSPRAASARPCRPAARTARVAAFSASAGRSSSDGVEVVEARRVAASPAPGRGWSRSSSRAARPVSGRKTTARPRLKRVWKWAAEPARVGAEAGDRGGRPARGRRRRRGRRWRGRRGCRGSSGAPGSRRRR